MFGSKKKRKEHREGLIKLYECHLEDAKANEMPFTILILEEALYMLRNGANPKKVEKWVVKIEKLYLYKKGVN
jgi:hypothetical protein